MRSIVAALCLCLAGLPASADKLAFVLGNADYAELDDLQNTHTDAEAYAGVFKTLGYDVAYHEDLTLDATEAAFETFLDRLVPGDEVIFVYSGHGWSDGSTNYLIPTDAPRQGRDRQLKRASLALRNGFNGVLDEFEAAGAALTVAIIDACRDNPFAATPGTRSAAIKRGLAPVKAATGTFVIYSAGEGQQALDRLPDDPTGPQLSVFTRTFLPHLESGVALERAISNAQVETAALARKVNGHLQHPAYYDQTLGDTCLAGACRATPVAAPAPPSQCDALFERASTTEACYAYEAYAETCTAHPMAPVAKSFIDRRCSIAAQRAALPPTGEFLGITLQPVSRGAYPELDLGLSEYALWVRAVETWAPAHASIRNGDIIQDAGQEPLRSVDDLKQAVDDMRAQKRSTVLLGIQRRGAAIFALLPLAEPDPNGSYVPIGTHIAPAGIYVYDDVAGAAFVDFGDYDAGLVIDEIDAGSVADGPLDFDDIIVKIAQVPATHPYHAERALTAEALKSGVDVTVIRFGEEINVTLKAAPEPVAKPVPEARLVTRKCYASANAQTAIRDCTEALAQKDWTDKEKARFETAIGAQYVALKQKEGALRHFQQAMALNPDHHRFAFNLAVVLAYMGRTEEMERVIEKIDAFDFYGESAALEAEVMRGIATNLATKNAAPLVRSMQALFDSMNDGQRKAWQTMLEKDVSYDGGVDGKAGPRMTRAFEECTRKFCRVPLSNYRIAIERVPDTQHPASQ